MNFIDLRPGKSHEGDDIKAYRTEGKAQKWNYIMAGTHGDEVEGVFVVQRLFEWLKDDDTLDFPLIVIPILNVDGYRAGTRVNANGVDLNRNYNSENWSNEAREAKYNPGASALSEPENKFLIKLFEKFPPKQVLTFHSWKPFINYNGDCREIAELLERYNGYEVCDEIQGHPTPGSLGSLVPEKYKSPVLTFECPVLSDEMSLNKIWEENRIGLETLMKSDLIN